MLGGEFHFCAAIQHTVQLENILYLLNMQITIRLLILKLILKLYKT